MALDSPDHATEPSRPFYPVCDDVVETGFHAFAIRLLVELFEGYFAAAGRPNLVLGNQFFYYKRGDPRAVVAPDVYVIEDDDRPATSVESWKTWEPDFKAPTLAIEIVSERHHKDYADAMLERYQQLGVRELVRYDAEGGRRRKRELFAHFVRDEQGQLVRQPVFGERVHLVAFDVWLVRQPDQTLRLGVGPRGAVLWPRACERAAAAEHSFEAVLERADAAAQRAATAEAALQDALAELERLRRERGE